MCVKFWTKKKCVWYHMKSIEKKETILFGTVFKMNECKEFNIILLKYPLLKI